MIYKTSNNCFASAFVLPILFYTNALTNITIYYQLLVLMQTYSIFVELTTNKTSLNHTGKLKQFSWFIL